MKINSWSVDRLTQLGIAPKDAQELRGLGVRLQLLDATLVRETGEAAEASADETPLTANEKRHQRLMARVHAILDSYADLVLEDGENGGVALHRVSDALAALDRGGLEAFEHIPRVEITW